MTGWMVLRMAREGLAGPFRCALTNAGEGMLGACFVYATEAQAIEAANGAGVVAVEIPDEVVR